MTSAARVLVVDDDAFMRGILGRVLADGDLLVETFASAQALLDEADFGTPGVLLLDVNMPGISGLELQSLLRIRGTSLPIIFLTGVSDVSMAVMAMRNGAVDFIEKPFDPSDLVRRVKRALESAAPMAPDPVRRIHSNYTSRLSLLTTREREVYDAMITGKTSKMIARDLGGSFRTIEIHRSRVMTKMESSSLADLVRMTFETTWQNESQHGGPQ